MLKMKKIVLLFSISSVFLLCLFGLIYSSNLETTLDSCTEQEVDEEFLDVSKGGTEEEEEYELQKENTTTEDSSVDLELLVSTYALTSVTASNFDQLYNYLQDGNSYDITLGASFTATSSIYCNETYTWLSNENSYGLGPFGKTSWNPSKFVNLKLNNHTLNLASYFIDVAFTSITISGPGKIVGSGANTTLKYYDGTPNDAAHYAVIRYGNGSILNITDSAIIECNGTNGANAIYGYHLNTMDLNITNGATVCNTGVGRAIFGGGGSQYPIIIDNATIYSSCESFTYTTSFGVLKNNSYAIYTPKRDIIIRNGAKVYNKASGAKAYAVLSDYGDITIEGETTEVYCGTSLTSPTNAISSAIRCGKGTVTITSGKVGSITDYKYAKKESRSKASIIVGGDAQKKAIVYNFRATGKISTGSINFLVELTLNENGEVTLNNQNAYTNLKVNTNPGSTLNISLNTPINNGAFNISGGTINGGIRCHCGTIKMTDGVLNGWIKCDTSPSTIQISGGVINQTDPYMIRSFGVDEGTKITIEDGTFNMGCFGNLIYATSSIVTISGGTFNRSNDAIVQTRGSTMIKVNGTSKLNISNGSFINKYSGDSTSDALVSVEGEATTNITGGNFQSLKHRGIWIRTNSTLTQTIENANISYEIDSTENTRASSLSLESCNSININNCELYNIKSNCNNVTITNSTIIDKLLISPKENIVINNCTTNSIDYYSYLSSRFTLNDFTNASIKLKDITIVDNLSSLSNIVLEGNISIPNVYAKTIEFSGDNALLKNNSIVYSSNLLDINRFDKTNLDLNNYLQSGDVSIINNALLNTGSYCIELNSGIVSVSGTGTITSENTNGTIQMNGATALKILDSVTISNTGTGSGIYNATANRIEVCGGSITGEYAINNQGTGAVYISRNPSILGQKSGIYMNNTAGMIYAYAYDDSSSTYTGNQIKVYCNPNAYTSRSKVVTSGTESQFASNLTGFALIAEGNDLFLDLEIIINSSGNINKSYDGNSSSIEMTVEIELENLSVTYQWYNQNDIVMEGENKKALSRKNVSDSGKYYCLVTVNYGDFCNEKKSDAVDVSITPKEITVEFKNYENLVYNKSEQEITVDLKGVVDGDNCTIKTMTGNKGKNAGDYTCSVTALSNSNYALSGTTSLGWSIAKYQVEKPLEDTTVYTYTGEEQTYQVEASEYYTVSNQTQRDAGTYIVTITLNDTDNYEWKNDPTKTELEYSFTIRQKAVDIIWSNNTFTYNGEEQDKTGIIAYYLTLPSSTKNYLTVKCNSESFKLAATYTFTVELDDTKNYTVANSSDSHSYTIDKASITLQAEDKSSAYGASLKELTYVVASGTNYHDEITPVLATTATTTSNVGTYPITITASSNDNYDITLTNGEYTITKAVYNNITHDEISVVYEEGLSLKDITLNSGFSFKNLNQLLTAGTNTVEAVYNLDSSKYEDYELEITIQVSKATPSITTNPTASSIYLGQTLANSVLTGGQASVEGTFSWGNPNTIPSVESNNYQVVFKPSDSVNYNEVNTIVSITVNELPKDEGGNVKVDDDNYNDLKDILDDYNKLPEDEKDKLDDKTKEEIDKIQDGINQYEEKNNLKVTPSILTIPVASDIMYGNTLSVSHLSGGQASVEGTFNWVNPNIIPTQDTNTYEVIFTPKDTTKYNTIILGVSVTINELPKDDSGNVKVDDDNYDDLKDILDDYNKLPEEEKDKIDDKTKEEIDKIQDGINQYEEKNNRKVTPSIITIPVALDITYGDTLSDSQLSGGQASVEGTFSWVNPNTIPNVGTNGYEVIFTPTDTTKYNTVTITVSVTVNELPKDDNGNVKVDDDNYDDIKDILDDYNKLPEEEKEKLDDKTKEEIDKIQDGINQYEEKNNLKVTPSILTIPVASDIMYGNTLSVSHLSGGQASVEGSFSWVNPNAIPAVGTNGYEVIFTPNDSTKYNTVTITVSVIVNDLPKDDDGNVKVDDDNFDDIKDILDDYDKLPEDEKDNIDDATKEDIDKIRDGVEDYLKENGIKTDPIILSNPSASKITYGQYLSSSSLSGGKANVEGEFAFSKPKLMPKKGIQTYEVIFTPTKSDIYNPIVLEVEVEVEELVNIPSGEDKPIEINKDNYEELKEIVDNYNNLTEEEKNEIDTEVKEEILRIEEAIQKYEGGNNLSKVLWLSIGIPCIFILILGIIGYVVIRKRKK